MKIEYDQIRDLLYVYFSKPGTKVADTVTVKAGVHADFDKDGKLIGLEVLDASDIVDGKIEFRISEVKDSAFSQTANQAR